MPWWRAVSATRTSASSERVSMASPPSAGATLHQSFGAIGEARQAAIAARSTVLRRTHPRWLLRASVAAGAVSTRCCRRAATAYARSCQAKSAAALAHRFSQLGDHPERLAAGRDALDVVEGVAEAPLPVVPEIGRAHV